MSEQLTLFAVELTAEEQQQVRDTVDQDRAIWGEEPTGVIKQLWDQIPDPA